MESTTVEATVQSIAIGGAVNVSVPYSKNGHSRAIALPYSTGYLTTCVDSVGETSIACTVWNFSTGAHSGKARIRVLLFD